MPSLARAARLAGRVRERPALLVSGVALMFALLTLTLVLAAIVRLTAPSTTAASALTGHSFPPVSLPAEQGAQLVSARPLLPGDGRPALVLFLFSLCPRCPTQAVAVNALARQRGLDLVVVDSPAETPAIAEAYAARLGLNGPILLDRSGALATRLGLDLYPALLLVDARGVVRDVWLGETSAQTVSVAVGRLSP